MQAAPMHPQEDRRIEALYRCGVLDSAPEAAFDDLTQLASALCGRPIALVSLVDTDRQWFKSSVGLGARETPRDLAFCAHAILDDGPIFEVVDATADPRFFDNPLVTSAPHVGSYAGAPLRDRQGLPLGTLCVIDHGPSQLTAEQRAGLEGLARVAERMLEQRVLLQELAEATKRAIELEEILKSYSGRTAWATLHDMSSQSLETLVADELVQAYVFADLSGFTKLSGELPSREVASLLNSFLGPASSLVYEHGGDVEKFIGDALFAVFPDSTAALEFAFELQASSLRAPPVAGRQLRFTVGIHCGEAVRVHLGSDDRRDNTLIGEAVNIAARLQSACPPGGILISDLSMGRSHSKRRGETQKLVLKGVTQAVSAQLFV